MTVKCLYPLVEDDLCPVGDRDLFVVSSRDGVAVDDDFDDYDDEDEDPWDDYDDDDLDDDDDDEDDEDDEDDD